MTGPRMSVQGPLDEPVPPAGAEHLPDLSIKSSRVSASPAGSAVASASQSSSPVASVFLLATLLLLFSHRLQLLVEDVGWCLKEEEFSVEEKRNCCPPSLLFPTIIYISCLSVELTGFWRKLGLVGIFWGFDCWRHVKEGKEAIQKKYQF